ncbi:MAG: TolC family protein [Pseudomonadota bacterium]
MKWCKSIAWISLFMLVGCASIPESTVPHFNQILQQRLSIAKNTSNTETQLILQQPLTATNAMRLALLNNKTLHAEFAELGIAQSDILAAGLVSNPTIAIGALRPEGGGRWQLDFGLTQSMLNLITRSLRTKIARIEYENIQMRVIQSLMHHLQAMEADYYSAIAEAHRSKLLKTISHAAETTYELAERFYKAGNISELEYLTQKNHSFEQKIKLLHAEHTAYEARLKLATQLGLKASQKFILPQQLYDVPQEKFDGDTLILQAKKQRLDLKILHRTVQNYAKNSQLLKNGIEEFDVSLKGEREFDGLKSYGPEFSLSLPIFNQGQARKLSFVSQTKQANYLIEALELSIENDIIQTTQNLNNIREQLQILRLQIIPNSQRQVQLSLQEYNFMLVGIAETLLLKQQEYDVYVQYIEILKQYWKARSTLAIALGSALPDVQFKPVVFDSPSNNKNLQYDSAPFDHSQHTDKKSENVLEKKDLSNQHYGAYHD